jgi:8-oxo-dGTP diphosphatase/2-hydroxy-dATP diphosphatase|tara:strand:+ start:67 stop:522 length:456 start_codon:yes stop_codon:yes gene_type:complete
MKKLLTLCIIHKDNKVLLGFKKRGFGEGRWNGFGGKVEKNETIEDSVLREIEEEAGIVPIDLRKRGVFEFTFEGDPEILEVHFFSASEFKGDPKESEEMRPQWFSEDEVPFDDMWPDDIHWFPLFIDDKNFKGKFYFKDPDTILEHTLEVI